MPSFYTNQELASDTYRVLSGEKSLRELVLVAASILGDLCDVVIYPKKMAELENSPVHDSESFCDYKSFCDWSAEYPMDSDTLEHWKRYWEFAGFIFYTYEQLPSLDDYDLYLELIDPLNPEWDSADSDKEQIIRDRMIETCFAITRWVKLIPAKTELAQPPAPSLWKLLLAWTHPVWGICHISLCLNHHHPHQPH